MTMNFSSERFLKQLIKSNKEINNTPIRGRIASGSTFILGKENIASNNTSNYSPRQGFKRNPIRNQQQKKRSFLHACANHFDKEGHFRIVIDGQNFIYCNKCAAHLASQGFQVQKIPGLKDEQSGQHPRKKELTNFLQNLRSLQGTYRQKLQVLTHINHSYQVEKSNSLNLYTSMLEYLQRMRDQHMKQVERQSIKNIQICEIQLGQIQETLQEIKTMKEDIQTNMRSIVDEVEQENYKECMAYYNQKVGIYQHRLQQLGQDVYEPQPIGEEQIDRKLQQFKIFIDGLLDSQQ